MVSKRKRFWSALKLYLASHVIAHVPSFRVRHWYYRHVLGYAIGRDSSIHMDVFVTGDVITLGDNVVINRRCYLDGRVGIDIRNNVSISPEVYIVSLEHDPDSPAFATRGATVVIEDHVLIHHVGGGSFKQLDPDTYRRIFEANRTRYEEKWGEPWIPHRYRPAEGAGGTPVFRG